jgi:hypothetical protein
VSENTLHPLLHAAKNDLSYNTNVWGYKSKRHESKRHCRLSEIAQQMFEHDLDD